MRQGFGERSDSSGFAIGELPAVLKRLWPVAVFFGIAFIVDMATDQQYSSVWGSIAIVASVVTVFPAVRPAVIALGRYGAVWLAFNLARAVADNLPLAVAGEEAVSGWERSLFGGALPSATMQDAWFDPDHVRFHDIALSIVHGSFFIVPFAVAALVWWRHRGLFRPYLVATAITFALGTVGFLLLPTAPSWASEPGDVTRVAHHVLASTAGIELGATEGDAGYWFEPNPLAAMPSVHVAVTVLVFLVAGRIGRLAGLLGSIYALAMSAAVVYLGEHFVIDALLGWVIALLGWRVAQRAVSAMDRP